MVSKVIPDADEDSTVMLICYAKICRYYLKHRFLIFCLPNFICEDIGLGYFEYKTYALPIFLIFIIKSI